VQTVKDAEESRGNPLGTAGDVAAPRLSISVPIIGTSFRSRIITGPTMAGSTVFANDVSEKTVRLEPDINSSGVVCRAKSVEVRVDNGGWQPAAMDPATSGKYSWKLFTYAWDGVTPGEHTLVSRVIDVNGKVQPTVEELETKKTFLEDNSQFSRKVMIA
jgi:hypothetical protein